MPKPKPITVKAAKSALNNLHKLKPANEKFDDDLEMSIKETIAFMAPDPIQLTKRGFTSKELSAGLATDGIHIKPGTLNRYLNEYLAAKQEVNKSEGGSDTDGPEKEKVDAAAESKPANSASRLTGSKDTGSQPSQPQAVEHESPQSEKQNGGTTAAKDRPSFNNPKTPSENPKFGENHGHQKSEWARAAETSTATQSV